MDLDQTFEQYYKEQQQNLRIRFAKEGKNIHDIEKLVRSGYYISPYDLDIVYDSFYGTSWGLIAQFPVKEVLQMMQESYAPAFKRTPRVYYISSVDEIDEKLSDDRSKHYIENGYLSYRGQRKEYKIKRDFPNPTMCDDDGYERLIIPGAWRSYYPNFNLRKLDGENFNVFSSGLADDLVYYGIDDYRNLGDRNYKKYGMHSISQIGDFPEKENQEYYKRYRDFKVNSYNSELAVVSQHYGLDTLGLDVTFDYKTAGFFSTQIYEKKSNGKVDYKPVAEGDHQGVIYCFYFRAPTLTSTKDLIKNLESFEHINPLRPIRQQCALPFFLCDKFNEAACNLYAIFYLNRDFDIKGIHSKEFLFPNRNEDAFYNALLDVKKSNKYLSDFVEYDF
jgi:hypothetical protein